MKKIKLNQLADEKLVEQEMNLVCGGTEAFNDLCQCSCRYADSGGSSLNSNGAANSAHGWHSLGVQL